MAFSVGPEFVQWRKHERKQIFTVDFSAGVVRHLVVSCVK
jgi:hypothetical protein